MDLTSPLQFQVYEYLKEQILSGELQNNTLYSETKIAAELGISRTPMRGAIHCLDQDGYITIIPSKGFMIRKLSETEMLETIQIRCAIEGFCAHMVASEIESDKAKELIKKLSNLLTSQEQELGPGGSRKNFTEYDHKFHLSLVNYANNNEFNKTYQRSMYLVHLTTTTALSFPLRVDDTFNEHKQFLTLLQAGDGDAAYKLLIDHLMMPLRMNILKDNEEIEQ